MNRPSLVGLASLVPLFACLVGCRSSSTIVASDPPAHAEAVTATIASARRTYPKPSPDVIKSKLTKLQYEVTQNDATEPPFHNEYWDNHEAGIYVDVVTGEPLFSSTDKFNSGTGWPSFSKPIDEEAVKSKSDVTLGMVRNEVRSQSGDSHLGHVFDDGPPPTGLRYCIDSASLRFIPVAELESQGYGAYRSRFGGAGSKVAATPPPDDSNNACASPPPGERAGCATTLDTAIVGGDDHASDLLSKANGVVQVERGTVAGASAIRVVFDPKVTTFAHLLDAWAGATANDAKHSILALTAAQKSDADAWKVHASTRGLAIESGDEKAFKPTR